jgi:hypothetical protein
MSLTNNKPSKSNFDCLEFSFFMSPNCRLVKLTRAVYTSQSSKLKYLVLLVVIRLTCSMHVSYARRAYMLPTLQQRIEEQSSINQQRIRIAIQ